MVQKKSTKRVQKSPAATTADVGLLDTVKEKVAGGVQVVKEKLKKGEELFADEIASVSSVAKKGSDAVEKGFSSVRSTFEEKFQANSVKEHSYAVLYRLQQNRQTILGIVLVAIALYMLWALALGLIILLVGSLLISGYFKK